MKEARKGSILVVDDDVDVKDVIRDTLAFAGFTVDTAEDGVEAMEKIQETPFDLILSDLMMPRMDGMELLRRVKEIRPYINVIIMTGYGTIESAVEAMKIGAADFITKPANSGELLVRVSKALTVKALMEENVQLRQEVKRRYSFCNIIGQSQAMQAVFSLIEKVSRSKSTVTIYGSSGTGKELVARAIHFNSPRRNKPFLAFNCSAIPDSLVESELFGHVKGSFTGAYHHKIGMFEEARGGTFFIDEIGNTSMALQAKLLRVLQEKEIRRVGSNEMVKIDVRLIAATNEDLEQKVRQGQFREDLFYRLHVIPIFLPDLRDRPEDVPLLAQHFLKMYARQEGREIHGFTAEAMKLLTEYDWPGNVRELENAVERAVVITQNSLIDKEDLPVKIVEGRHHLIKRAFNDMITLEELKNQYTLMVLEKTKGNKKMAAQILGINPRTLYRKKKQGIIAYPAGAN
ncbi:MAG: sigma-54-dependent Fis family transcriptional regulator [Deltaproteobacteria bacterium]|nr:sigma-54-dependent Fis family transcriptional regulator [Deltaproteobacteria bacterium]MBW2120757.1 sigma-54-dependent Fis family transcriptional regulator [Deltaproteobacteria bacterium]